MTRRLTVLHLAANSATDSTAGRAAGSASHAPRHATRRAHAAPDAPADRPRLAVLLPAHNEQDRIAAALDGLWRQTRRPDLVIVVADNCTDDTAAVAASLGAQVFPTQGNTHKKAGALNQAIAWVLPWVGRHLNRPPPRGNTLTHATPNPRNGEARCTDE